MNPDELLLHLNTTYEDSILLVGRVLGRRPDVSSSRVVQIDRRGLELVLVDQAGEHTARVDFARPLTEMADAGAAALEVVMRARTESGEPGETTAEREYRRLQAITTFVTAVSAVEDVHPHLRRITFAGGDLGDFTPLGPDTFLYLLLPPPGRNELTIDRSFTWEQHHEMPAEEQPVGAYYTVRHWRPDVVELDMLFVLHEPAGPASAWAASAQPGDPVALWGPREAFEPPAGTDRYLLVADDTGLPAVAAILEALPPGTPATVVAEVDHPGERQALASRAGVEVTWVYRHGRPPGTTADALLTAVRAVPPTIGTPYVWGGAESRAMTAVRGYVRGEVGLGRDQVSLVAYWRHGENAKDDRA